MDNDLSREVVLLQVMHLNDKSELYFWATVIITGASLFAIVAALKWGSYFLFLSAACWVLARMILMPQGIAMNKEAQRLLQSIKD